MRNDYILFSENGDEIILDYERCIDYKDKRALYADLVAYLFNTNKNIEKVED